MIPYSIIFIFFLSILCVYGYKETNNELLSETLVSEEPADYFLFIQEWGGNFKSICSSADYPQEEFTIFGYWPIAGGKVPSTCTDAPFNLEEIKSLVPSLNTFWPDKLDHDNEGQWTEDWLFYGACFGRYQPSQLNYFNTALKYHENTPTLEYLTSADIVPSDEQPYIADTILSAVKAGSGVQPILSCLAETQRYINCDVDNLPSYFYDHDCELGSEIFFTKTPAPNLTYLAPRPTRQLFTSRKIDYFEYGAAPAAVVLILGLLSFFFGRFYSFFSQQFKRFFHLSPPKFSASEMHIVQFPGVIDTVEVKLMTLDAKKIPIFGHLLETLPEGVGIYGGIARKIFKLLIAVPSSSLHLRKEAEQELGIQLLIFIKDANPVLVSEIRKQLDGISICGLSANPSHAMIISNFEDFFNAQDITQNELESTNVLTLVYTKQAFHDCLNGIICPSIHSLCSPTSVNWFCTDSGEPIVGPKLFTKSLLHKLQGHGTTYRIPESTWQYYRSHPLGLVSTFNILKHFERQPFYMESYTQLLQLGVVLPSSKPSELWGDALLAIHKKLALHGLKFEIKPLKLGIWEAWQQVKMKEMEQWKNARMHATHRRYIESAISSNYSLPERLKYFDQFANAYSEDFFASLGENIDEEMLQQFTGQDLELKLIGRSIEFSRAASTRLIQSFKSYCEKDERSKALPEQNVDETTAQDSSSLSLMDRLGYTAVAEEALKRAGMEWHDTQLLPLETLADFQTVGEDGGEKELLHQHDPTIPQLPSEYKDNPHKKTAIELVLKLMSICRTRKLLTLVVIICMFAFLGLRLAVSYLEGQIVSEMVRFQRKEVGHIMIGTLILIAVEFCAGIAWNYGIIAVTTAFLSKFQINLFSHLVYQDLEFHEKIKTGEKMVKLSGDIKDLSMRSLISRILPTFLSGLVMSAASMIIAFAINWQLSLILTSFVSISAFVAWGYGIFARSKSREMRGIAGKMFRLSYDSFANCSIMQSFANEGHTISQYNLIVDELQQCNRTIQIVKVLYILGGRADVGDVFTALFIIHLCMTGVQQLYLSYGAFMLAIGSLERLFYIVNFAPRINRPNYNTILDPFEGKIEFSDVNFAYPSRRNNEVLKKVNFSVNPGEILIISGLSGCGKSTILSLVQQFYRPGCGKIFFDGNDSAVLDPFWLRSQMGIISSDYSTIFSTTVYHNLVLDIPFSDPEQIGATEMIGLEKQLREVMSQVGLDSFFQNLPNGYNTMLGENGLPLSLAQILLLDDPCRGLDSESEKDFLKVLKQSIYINKTTTIICCESPQKLHGILNGNNLRVVYLLNGKIEQL